MGTRGAFGFRYQETDKITYNHFDSYPSGLGKDLLTELIVFGAGKTYEQALETMRTTFADIRMVQENGEPTAAEIERYKKFANTSVSTGDLKEWYVLLRNIQGQLAPFLDGTLGVMMDSNNFMLSSLWCEFAYVINLDTERLEVYRGFNKNCNAAGRYAAQVHPSDKNDSENEYYGVALLREWPLSDVFDGKVTADTMCGLEDEDDEEDPASETGSVWDAAAKVAENQD